MFTGIIQQIGTVSSVHQDGEIIAIEIQEPSIAPKLRKGGSIAIDGACFTATNITPNTFTVEAMPETAKKTIINNYKPKTQVNLELPLNTGDPIDGHFVLGHVDAVCNVIKIEGTDSLNITVQPPENLIKYIAAQGSITINGVSLTVSAKQNITFTVSLIPETIKRTTLGQLKPNDQVNVEIDMLARYIESLTKK